MAAIIFCAVVLSTQRNSSEQDKEEQEDENFIVLDIAYTLHYEFTSNKY